MNLEIDKLDMPETKEDYPSAIFKNIYMWKKQNKITLMRHQKHRQQKEKTDKWDFVKI